MAKTLTQEQAAVLEGLRALLNQDAPSTKAATRPAAKVKAATPEVEPQDALMDKLGIRYGKGSTVLTPEAIKAAARVLKTGAPEAIAKDEGNGSHVVIFRTDKGNVRVQNAYTPKA